jgi:hypothetical protein
MEICERIEFDAEDLKLYFQKLFEIIENLTPNASSYRFASFSKFDMACNIYSFLEFWLQELCQFLKKAKKLNLSYTDIKADNDLAKYNKYLQKVAVADTKSVKKFYDHLQNLRKVRNHIIHHGAHTENSKLNGIKGIKMNGSLLSISKEYIFENLDYAKNYLLLKY